MTGPPTGEWGRPEGSLNKITRPRQKTIMRKATLIAIALLLPAVSLLASPVKKSAAKATATAFLQKQVSHSNGAKHAPRKLELVSAEADNAPYYVFNNQNGEGFAIVSGDDTVENPILGYSTEGNLSEENMPEALRAILADYAAVVEFAQQNGLSMKRAPRKANRTDVTPFMEYTWDQGLPYCNLTPVANNDKGHCSLGCMAVTVSMIVAHYGKLQTENPGQVMLPGHTNGSNNLRSDARTYDVSQFRQVYEKNEYSGTYPDPGDLDDFMYHIANLLDTKYDADGSSATESRFVPTMTDYLGYNANMKSIMRDAYSAEDWEEIIYNELAAGRPVNLLGSHPDLGGHSYLCDGYRSSDGFFHMIWGWGTTAVGYFDMNVLNPFVQYLSMWGRMGYNCPPSGFTSGLKAIIGIQPETVAGNSVQLMTTDDIIKDGVNAVRAQLFNYDDRTFTGVISWAVLNEDGTFTQLENAPANTVNISYKGYTNQTLQIGNLALADGYYKLVPICKTNEEGAEWNLCEGYQQKYVEVDVADGNLTIVPHPVKNVTAEMVTYNNATGKYLELLVKLQNHGDDVFGFLTITGTRDDGVKVYGSKLDVAMKAGQSQLLSLFIENGGTSSFDYYGHTYEVTVQYLHGDIGTFTIDPGASAPSASYITYQGVDFDDYEYVGGNAYLYNTTLKGNVNISCSSSGYYAPVKLTLKDENSQVVYEKTTMHNFYQKGTKPYYIEATGLQAGKKYYLTAQLVKLTRSSGTYTETVVKTFFSDFAINVTVGVPYYTENGTVDRAVVTGTDLINLPANTAAVDFRKFGSDMVNLSSITNENCVYVFNAGDEVPAELNGKNVVVGDVAEKITLAEGKPIAFPTDFTATEISYTRTFTVGNNGDGMGWQTIVLPFSAKVSVDGKDQPWFKSDDDSGLKFWLYRYTGSIDGTVYFDYETASQITADEPYIISVPGDAWGPKYDLTNKVFTFSATNAQVKGNVKPEKTAGFYILKGTYGMGSFADAYLLNDDGDFFELTAAGEETPFHAIIMPKDGQSGGKLGLGFEMGELPTAINGITVDGENKAPVFDLQGRRIENAQKGLYIRNGKKVVIK